MSIQKVVTMSLLYMYVADQLNQATTSPIRFPSPVGRHTHTCVKNPMFGVQMNALINIHKTDLWWGGNNIV